MEINRVHAASVENSLAVLQRVTQSHNILLGIYPREIDIYLYKNVPPMCIAALFIIAKKWKPPKKSID